jgi:hypothetical protein
MSRSAISRASAFLGRGVSGTTHAIGATILTCALSYAALGSAPALAGAVHDGLPAAPNCAPLQRLLAAARRMGEVGEVQTAVYVGVPGAALLQAFNRETSAGVSGVGLFVARIPGVDEVMIGIVAPDHSMVCGGRIMTNDAWSALETYALGQQVRLRIAPSAAGAG